MNALSVKYVVNIWNWEDDDEDDYDYEEED